MLAPIAVSDAPIARSVQSSIGVMSDGHWAVAMNDADGPDRFLLMSMPYYCSTTAGNKRRCFGPCQPDLTDGFG